MKFAYIYIITYQYSMYISRKLDYWEGEGGKDTDRSEFLQRAIQVDELGDPSLDRSLPSTCFWWTLDFTSMDKWNHQS